MMMTNTMQVRTKRMRNFVVVFSLSILTAWLILPRAVRHAIQPTAFATAKVFTVNVNGDGHDANPGDGICETSISGNCSLRAAIEEANVTVDKDTINFSIPGTGVHTITPNSVLPDITNPVVIDGYSQLGASTNTEANSGDNAVLLIHLQGSNAGVGATGLNITAGGSTVKGLVINSFSGTAINLTSGAGNGGNTIQGNFIGTNPAGTAAFGNAGGVSVTDSGANLIGGLHAADRNVMSGNGTAVQINSGTGNLVQNNFIGTNAAGNAALPNNPACDCGAVRVLGTSDNTTIGGLGEARNLISGNSKHGVEIGVSGFVNVPTRTKIQHNTIGTGILGNPLGNGGSGVLINGTRDTIIGGAGDTGNRIAFNGANGVTNIIGDGNQILSNSIFSNGKLGIDLNDDGVTPNDAGDADSGPNLFNNFPVITSVSRNDEVALINGTLNSIPGTSFRIEFFSNQSCNPSGNGEGQTLIGSINTETDEFGNAAISAAAPISSFFGNFVTATATDSNGNTSEFSQCTQLSTPLPVVQFGQSTYSAFEDCTAVTITVARQGDTSTAASVAYATQSGSATERFDFNTAAGRISFAPGETAKSFDVLISDDSYVEGTESFTVALSEPSGATLGFPSTATIQMFDDQPESAANPIDSADDFVCQHYHDFLNREDDSQGLAFWTDNITGCGTDAACIQRKRVDTSAAFLLSFEFQETGGFVLRSQRAAFGKKSEDPLTRITYNQFVRDARQVGEGVVVGQTGFDVRIGVNEQAYATQLVTSAAFIDRYPLAQTADQYVDALFASAGVTPKTAERQAAINAFGAGDTAGRTAALRSVGDSDSVGQAEFTPTFVLMQYFGYLRRNPTDAPDNNDSGYQFWLAKLNQFGGDFRRADMVKAFITSAEYRSRFGQP
jgi:CSLREA domain-containing protein